jgi:hypothetical protein
VKSRTSLGIGKLSASKGVDHLLRAPDRGSEVQSGLCGEPFAAEGKRRLPAFLF